MARRNGVAAAASGQLASMALKSSSASSALYNRGISCGESRISQRKWQWHGAGVSQWRQANGNQRWHQWQHGGSRQWHGSALASWAAGNGHQWRKAIS